jgi:hypothetical protein
VNFKEYFFREFIENPFEKKDKQLMSSNTGTKHHQTLGRFMKMGERKKGLHLVAKSQSQPKKTFHPKVDHCMKLKKNVPLSEPEAIDIIKKYKICPTQEEPKKAIKQTGVNIHMIQPRVYMLSYTGGGRHGTAKIS